MIVSKNDVPANDLKALIAWIKANPDKVSAGTAGAGSARRISAAFTFSSFSGAKLQFVPYRGTGPAMLDLIGGQIELMVDQSSNSLPQVRRQARSGPMAVTANKRLAAAPDIPTVDEAGHAGLLHVELWTALWVPKGTPKDDRRQAQRRGACGAGRSGDRASGWPTRPGNSAARASRRRKPSPPINKPKSKNGGR